MLPAPCNFHPSGQHSAHLHRLRVVAGMSYASDCEFLGVIRARAVSISTPLPSLPFSRPFASVVSMCLSCLTCFFCWLLVFRTHVCSVQDYWEGYKLFCYAYYSHSVQHEYEFLQSKLGSLLAHTICLFSIAWFYTALLLSRLLPCLCHFTNPPPSLLLCRPTSLEAPCPISSSFPPYAPHNLHADPSSC